MQHEAYLRRLFCNDRKLLIKIIVPGLVLRGDQYDTFTHCVESMCSNRWDKRNCLDSCTCKCEWNG